MSVMVAMAWQVPWPGNIGRQVGGTNERGDVEMEMEGVNRIGRVLVILYSNTNSRVFGGQRLLSMGMLVKGM